MELSLRHRTCVTEVLFNYVLDARPVPSDPFMMCSPFASASNDLAVVEESVEQGNFEPPWKIDYKTALRGHIYQFCHREGSDLISDGSIYESEFPKKLPRSSPSLEKQSMFSAQAICLTDASNVYTAAISLQPRTVDKLTKIALGFIRGLSAAVHFSFLDPHHNPSDLGTKMSGGRAISLKHSMGRRFDISFAGRRELKRLENSPK